MPTKKSAKSTGRKSGKSSKRKAAGSARKKTATKRARSTKSALPKKGGQVQHLRGVGNKEQREYEHIKENAEKSGRYGKRAEEVAARTVMKHHGEEEHKPG